MAFPRLWKFLPAACLTALRRGFEEQAPARAVSPWVMSAHLKTLDQCLCPSIHHCAMSPLSTECPFMTSVTFALHSSACRGWSKCARQNRTEKGKSMSFNYSSDETQYKHLKGRMGPCVRHIFGERKKTKRTEW